MKIRETIYFEAVRWNRVFDLLVVKFGLTFSETDALVHDFFKRHCKLFNLYWFINSTLSYHDNMLLSAICNCHGADVVELHHVHRFRLGSVTVQYLQKIEFEPDFKAGEEGVRAGTCCPWIEVGVMGRQMALNTARRLIGFQLCLTIVAILTYVISVGLLFYGFSVLFIFLQDPGATTLAATRRAPLGLALLCTLVGLAGFFGRAVSNLISLADKRLRSGEKKSKS